MRIGSDVVDGTVVLLLLLDTGGNGSGIIIDDGVVVVVVTTIDTGVADSAVVCGGGFGGVGDCFP